MRIGIAVAIILSGVLGVEAQTVFSAAELRVRSGETLIIDSDQLSIRVENWVMEDNSTIRIPSNVCDGERCAWSITAETARIGSGVRILGSGDQGSNGESPRDRGASARGRCKSGGKGKDGSDGLQGDSGVDVDITTGLLSFGDLLFDVGGGDGGNGATGGNGGNGSRGSCSNLCKGGRGGDGGSGGQAGAGGDGGDITFSYWIVSVGPVTEPVAGQNLRTITEGGSPGGPGASGDRGAGGAGTGDCGIWPYFRRGGGRSGKQGAQGASAHGGANGNISITPVTNPS